MQTSSALERTDGFLKPFVHGQVYIFEISPTLLRGRRTFAKIQTKHLNCPHIIVFYYLSYTDVSPSPMSSSSQPMSSGNDLLTPMSALSMDSPASRPTTSTTHMVMAWLIILTGMFKVEMLNYSACSKRDTCIMVRLCFFQLCVS